MVAFLHRAKHVIDLDVCGKHCPGFGPQGCAVPDARSQKPELCPPVFPHTFLLLWLYRYCRQIRFSGEAESSAARPLRPLGLSE